MHKHTVADHHVVADQQSDSKRPTSNDPLIRTVIQCSTYTHRHTVLHLYVLTVNVINYLIPHSFHGINFIHLLYTLHHCTI